MATAAAVLTDLLVSLYAIVDSELWDAEALRAWADSRISELDRPSEWILNLSMCGSGEAAQASLSAALEETGVVLPENYGDLLAGCIILRSERTGSTKQELLVRLFDACDAYAINGLEVSRLGELASADTEALARAWPELEASMAPLLRTARNEEDRIRSEKWGACGATSLAQ
ncbi:hypothetical protein G6O69_28540 [Pseudenhygromyxa sp. WMMC2535]|uniref:hypothetical protein n=1 Tax=Pseudenhygromyxa sp. WMMC2535 TaxID=2712867 RepID=UPI001552DC79|nr:hypothetical protein [Pseudenhygromyxa sp. WMMC2535]NVB41815.1 hypothetical protein [Pseudenhygromyxa sp. WMMC2535]